MLKTRKKMEKSGFPAVIWFTSFMSRSRSEQSQHFELASPDEDGVVSKRSKLARPDEDNV